MIKSPVHNYALAVNLFQKAKRLSIYFLTQKLSRILRHKPEEGEMPENLTWFFWSLGLVAVWLAVYLFRNEARKRMLWASLLTMPFGLTEPLFVPEYWNPPSLFDLARRTGFDIESLIFCFCIGFKEKYPDRRRYLHAFSLCVPFRLCSEFSG
jgi:hypothetical protein